jgi:hypothetical protein
VVAAGPKWVPWWRPASIALNTCAWLINHNYVTTFEGFDAPWSHLDRLLPDLAVEEAFSAPASSPPERDPSHHPVLERGAIAGRATTPRLGACANDLRVWCSRSSRADPTTLPRRGLDGRLATRTELLPDP